MKPDGVSKVKLLILVALGVLLLGTAYFAWSWGKIEFHVQRLGTEDRELALASELALLELGEPGRDGLYNYLLEKLSIKLPPLSLASSVLPQAPKIVAVSGSGEVRAAGAVGPAEDVVLLADSAAPVEKICTPLAELARAGTVRVLAGAFSPGSKLVALEIDLVFLSPEQQKAHLTLRVGQKQAFLARTPVANSREIESFLKDKTVESVKVIPKPGVRYARLLRFICHLQMANVRPVLVFGEPDAFGMPSAAALEELSRSLSAADETEQAHAAVRLKTAFAQLFSYDISKPPSQNRTAIENWLKWLEKNRAFVYFETVAGKYCYNAAAAAAGVSHEKYWLEKLRILKREPDSSSEEKEEKH